MHKWLETKTMTLVGASGRWVAALLVLLFLGVACGPSAPTAEAPLAGEASGQEGPAATAVPADAAAESGYPPPQPPLPTVPQEGYPVAPQLPPTATPLPDVYPPPAEEILEPRFGFDLPLRSGATSISGQAPPNLSLAIVDVTFNGELLGSGVSTADGQFTIGVLPLREGNRIGVTFGELEPGLSIADMSIKYYPYRGDGFMNIPNVGIMLESTLVEP